MYIEQLEYIVEVTKTKSITQAAENLHVSQSGISRSITNLEKELGVKIFKRTRIGTVPTDEGKKIVEIAFDIVMKLEQLKLETKQINLMAGELKIAAIPSLFQTVLSNAITAFKKAYPRVVIEMTEKRVQDVVDDVKQDKSHLGLIGCYGDMSKRIEGVKFQKLLEGGLQVCVSKNSPLASKSTLTPEDLLNQTVAAYNGENINTFLNDFFNKYGSLEILLVSNHFGVIQKSVAEGTAISFFFDIAQKNDHLLYYEGIKTIPLVNFDPAVISYGYVQSKKNKLPMFAEEFLSYLKLHIEKGNY